MLKKVSFKFPIAEIAKSTGYSKGSVSEILKENRSPTDEFLEKFAKAYNIEPNSFEEIALKSFSENKTAYNEQFNEIAKVEEPTGYYYPDVMAAAGVDKEVLNNEINKIPINIPNWGKDLDFINVFGDSMYPKFSSGEIIGIKEVEFAYIIYGFAYVVVLDNGDVYVKYIKKGSTIEHVVLESENKFYESKEFHLSQIKRVYQIKGVITKITM
ncbi:LexA family transcriptional regulator [Flavobacterium psychrophilum]|nr:LexA family transcriptional regulator [Flavobacterium psychrophilum]ELM3651203.1 LexA family transcriptional regulator [Flavobacterium psychrophilum]ELM3672276.1 LexA family transcriptional regulator [Flavobacterium psychrophilum]ELM3726824.1 LexA family transcriptional regulator [Flavobacterium psychrophilum]